MDWDISTPGKEEIGFNEIFLFPRFRQVTP